MQAVIAIVGRPNVGKSTLFNRLTSSRKAIVADQPGVTRDRQYGWGNFQGQDYILIDTGGLSTNNPEDMTDLVSAQSLQAIQEADALIWLVDGANGATSEDENLAVKLRPLCNQIFLVANKTERRNTDLALSDFYRFGFRGPYAVSAQCGHGIGHLLSDLIRQFPKTKESAMDRDSGLRIAVLGRPNVGKSTLINTIVKAERMLVSGQAGTTRDSIAVPFEHQGARYTLIDTAGVRKRAKITEKVEKFSVIQSLRAIGSAQVIMLILDAHAGITEQDASLLGIIADSGKALIIAINKWDNLDSAKKSSIKTQLDYKLGFVDYACIHYLSALHGNGIDELFVSVKKIAQTLLTKPSTAKVTNILHQAMKAHPPPIVHGRRIKLRYAHIGGRDPIRVVVHGNRAQHVPAPFKRYLAKQMRQQLKLIGTPVLIELKSGGNPYATQGAGKIRRGGPRVRRRDEIVSGS